MSKQLGTVKTGALSLKQRFSGHITNLVLFGAVIGLVFLAHDRILEFIIVPVITQLETVWGFSHLIGWFRGVGAETWDWSKISVVAIAVFSGYLFRVIQIWRTTRKEPEKEVKVAEEPQAPSATETSAKTQVDKAVAETKAVASETKATVTKSVDELEKEIAALKEAAK